MADPIRGLPTVGPSGLVGQSPIQAGAGSEAAARAFGAIAQSAREIGAAIRRNRQPAIDENIRREAEAQANEDFEAGVGFERMDVSTREDVVRANAYEAAYLARFTNAADDVARDAARKYAMDPDGFRSAMDGWLEERAQENVLTPDMVQYVEARSAAYQDEIAGALEASEMRDAQQDLERRLNNITQAYQTGIVNDRAFASSPEAQALMDQAQDVVDALVNNPRFEWGEERGGDAMDALVNGAEESLFYADVEDAFVAGGREAALDRIDALVTQQELTNQERIALRGRLGGHLSVLEASENARRATQERAAAQATAQREAEAREFIADVQLRLTLGGDVTPDEVARVQALRAGDWITQSQYNTVLGLVESAASPRDEPDPMVDLALQRIARDPSVPEEDFVEGISTAVSERNITPQRAEALMNTRRDLTNERIAPATSLLQGYFATSMFDFAGGVAAAEQEALIDIQDWAAANPEATRSQILAQARQIAAEYGRQAPEPPLPTSVDRVTDVQGVNIDEWRRRALLQAARQYGISDPASASPEQAAFYRGASQRINAYAEWLRAQRAPAGGGSSE